MQRFRIPGGRWWIVLAAVGAFLVGGATVTVATHDFPDVLDGAFYHDDVSWIKERGITLGCGGGNYCPNNYVTRGEMAAFLHRMGTGGSPRAFGFINSDGTKASGTTNVSSTWNAGSTRYEITIAEESYFWLSYATVVTPGSNCGEVHPWTNSVGGKLLVFFTDDVGADVQCAFQFATFEP